ncbi:hypothetical protein [Sneathiella glossodoripedis]|uniref:hypothetical protein n=1 Tax=Sneathiella glossodoripedis TaxID=418853 RepID=UPI0004726A54|nr:hypothetical protein [Sneathiella glossodoripedis]
MQQTHDQNTRKVEKVNNLKAIFDILAYLQVDACEDGHVELSDRLGFAMNCAEQELKQLQKENEKASEPSTPPVA